MQAVIHHWQKTGANYTRFGFNGKEFDWEAKGWMNQIDFGLRVYDPRIGRFLSSDPVYKEYESPYAAFSNNPNWFVDPNGADTAKYLSNSQVVDAIKVAYNIIKAHLDKKDFSLANIYSSEILDASVAYYKEHQKTMSLEAFNEFYEQALDYQRGFKEVAASIGGPKAFGDLGRVIFNENNTASKLTIQLTQQLINSKNGEAGGTAANGARAFTIVMGVALPGPAGKGPTGPRITPSTQQAIVESQAGVRFTNTTLNRYLDPSRTVSAADLRKAIATEGVADAQGAAGATTHYTTILRNNSQYNLKVVYHAETNTIYHFHYSRSAMGPLPKIKR